MRDTVARAFLKNVATASQCCALAFGCILGGKSIVAIASELGCPGLMSTHSECSLASIFHFCLVVRRMCTRVIRPPPRKGSDAACWYGSPFSHPSGMSVRTSCRQTTSGIAKIR